MLWRRLPLLAAVGAMLMALAAAECPNGCSGNGECKPKDMCECYPNFQGNDCSERTCLFAYAHVDTPRGDLNMDQSRMSVTSGTNGWILANSQQAPAGTYEYFNPAAADSEAHFYLECANKGICDRATGLCTCFDGYEGNGCARTTCPNKCNGHGVCHSIRQLGEKAGGTLFGLEQPAGSVGYDLWDANSTYGCRCDPWYSGADCSRRTCKVGVDPLYLSAGTPTYETFVIHAFDTLATAVTGGSMRLRLFDYYGEAYITKPIALVSEALSTDADKNAAAVAAAIKAVPNQTFRTVRCERIAKTGGTLAGFLAKRPDGPTANTPALGMSVICQYIDNPGKMRIPEIVSVSVSGTAVTTATTKAFVTTTANQGWDDDWFTVQTTAVLDTAATVVAARATPWKTWAAASTSTDVAIAVGTATVPQLIKLGPHIVLAATSTVTARLDFVNSIQHALSSTDAVVFTADSAAGLAVTALNDGAGTPAAVLLTLPVAVGDTKMTFDTVAPDLKTGDLIFYENQFFNVQQVYLASTKYTINLDKPFGGNSLDGGSGLITAVVYKVTRPDKTKVYNYVSACSGRGLCSAETGLCTCFKGYTNDNCNTQNILAL